MSLKNIVSAQYQALVDAAAMSARHLSIPTEGWICTVRKALGMSTIQLAQRIKVTRAFISRTEKAELNDAVTLKTMRKMATAMNCRFVYAIVPDTEVKELIYKQAKLKAQSIVNETNTHMALEDQLLSEKQIHQEMERLTQEFIKENHSDLWDSKWSENDNLS